MSRTKINSHSTLYCVMVNKMCKRKVSGGICVLLCFPSTCGNSWLSKDNNKNTKTMIHICFWRGDNVYEKATILFFNISYCDLSFYLFVLEFCDCFVYHLKCAYFLKCLTLQQENIKLG
jgi:hypothetical protein